MIDENWNSQNVTMTANTTETGANIYMLGNEILILPTVAYDGGIGLIPGVYVFDD